jgi:hypothetical protein
MTQYHPPFSAGLGTSYGGCPMKRWKENETVAGHLAYHLTGRRRLLFYGFVTELIRMKLEKLTTRIY